jgi:hypothetical protein
MQDIDFLPAGFRESNARRLRHLWQMMLVGVLLACCAGGTVFQLWQRFEIQAEIAAVLPSFEETTALAARLEQTKARLEIERIEARLIAYLDHPWPKSQILAAVLRPLNDAITLEEIHVAREQIAAPGHGVRKPPVHVGALPTHTTDSPQKPPAERDLAELQAEYDSARLVVHLTGVTHEGIDLYKYIAAITQDPLVEKADLSSLESNNRNETPGLKALSKFHARILIRPGYGQPRGPIPTRPDGPSVPRDKRIARTGAEHRP